MTEGEEDEGKLTRGRNEGEQDLPEDCDEVHDVVHAGGKVLFSAFVVILPFFACREAKRRMREETGGTREGGRRNF